MKKPVIFDGRNCIAWKRQRKQGGEVTDQTFICSLASKVSPFEKLLVRPKMEINRPSASAIIGDPTKEKIEAIILPLINPSIIWIPESILTTPFQY
jgi:hypothetical protein